jgi:O-methyltransferase
MSDVPAQQFRLLRKFIPRRAQPLLRGLRKKLERRKYDLSEPYRTIFPFTQVSQQRQKNLARLAEEIELEKIPGAIVECGVLDGGTAALMGYYSKDRPIHLFDSWSGLPHASEKDGAEAHIWDGQVVGSMRRVTSIMQKLGIDQRRVRFHKGWFSDTFPKAEIENIALLHIDADLYESVKLSLETWTPKLSRGGYIQIDDYFAFVGCKTATDEFLSKHPKLRAYKDDSRLMLYIRC